MQADDGAALGRRRGDISDLGLSGSMAGMVTAGSVMILEILADAPVFALAEMLAECTGRQEADSAEAALLPAGSRC
jgi:hypothetical protein